MIYFDNAATTLPKPPGVIQAVADAMQSFGNASRGAHRASLCAMRSLAEARQAMANFFGAPDPQRVVFTSGATEALNIALAGVKGKVVTTAAEHNSVLRPLYRRGGGEIVPVDSLGRLDIEKLRRSMAGAGALIMTHASNVTGNVYDICTAGAICRECGALFIVDAAQTAGLISIDMQQMGISALCFSGHKALYGPQGTGALILGMQFQPPPWAVGGSGGESFSKTHPAELPDALEAGTRNAHGVAGLLAGLNHVRQMNGKCFIEANRLAAAFVDRVCRMDGFIVYGDLDAPLRTPTVCINQRRIQAAELAYELDVQFDIAVRAGVHCAPLIHEALGTHKSGAVRFSFSHFNRQQEIECALEALRYISRDA